MLACIKGPDRRFLSGAVAALRSPWVRALPGAVLIVLVSAAAAVAQPATGSVRRTPLQRVEFPQGHTTLTSLIEIQPGGSSGRHSHPGLETGYILQGEIDVTIDGMPDQKLGPGDSFAVPPGRAHNATARGDQAARVFVVYVVEAGRPLVAPEPPK